MRRLAAVILVAASTAACHDESPTGSGRNVPAVVAFGDSLTSGPGLKPEQTYPALLQERIAETGHNDHVINAGVSGDTTTEALARFDNALTQDTRIVVLAIGINDGLHGVPVATVERNIATMIEHAQARGIRVLLCAMEAPPISGLGYTLDFHRLYTRLKERFNVPLVPFFLIGLVGNDNFDLNDTLHPNAAGHRVIADTIWPYLRPML